MQVEEMRAETIKTWSGQGQYHERPLQYWLPFTTLA